MQKRCIFCRIAKGEMPTHKIWEDKNFLAVLDVNPNVKGMALVITKKHYDSYAFDMTDKEYSKFLLAAKKVAKLLDKKLGVKRTAMVMEGLGINHAHIKLYPVHGLGSKFREIWAKKRVYFKKYPGYITTQLGPKAKDKDLLGLSRKLRSNK